MREPAVGGPSGSPDLKPEAAATTVTQRHASAPERSAPERPASEVRDYRAAFNVARLPMALVGSDGRVREANPALGALLGADPVLLTARTAAELVGLTGAGGEVPRSGRARSTPSTRTC